MVTKNRFEERRKSDIANTFHFSVLMARVVHFWRVYTHELLQDKSDIVLLFFHEIILHYIFFLIEIGRSLLLQ
jgi:hypothetical protein